MIFSLPGIKVPHRKNTKNMAPERIENVASVQIPMSMHIGKPAIPVVAVGDKVFVGTLIAEQSGFISSVVYSSVSGVVKGFGEVMMPNSRKSQTIIIESDGEMKPDPAIAPPTVETRADFVEAVKRSGTVGLGGAGFPVYVKFSIPEDREIDELLINCAECEPYITSDTRTMLDRTEDMKFGIEQILKYFPVKRVVIGIEKNKGAAIDKMKSIAANDPKITVKILPSVYPQGGEKVLIYHTTGKVVPAGKLPIDVGCIVCNCTTVAAIGSYIKTGMPLVKKCITIDGGAIASPKNVIAPIGASIKEIIELSSGFKCEPAKILLGGPMMGNAVNTVDFPIMKNTNAVLAFNEAEAAPKPETACIKCGTCASRCPYHLNPAAFLRAYNRGDMEELIRLRIDICMECGCCSYSCPAAKPLVETNKLSKAAVREYSEKKRKSESEKKEEKK